MRSVLAARSLLLLWAACVDHGESDYFDYYGEPGIVGTGSSDELDVLREAGKPPPTVYARIEFSDYAVPRFRSLDVIVDVYSAESVEGQGLRAEWLQDFDVEPVRANFGGEFSATWSGSLSLASSPCTGLPCAGCQSAR